jgi:riboflavin synthase
MFTGLIQSTGVLLSRTDTGGDARLSFKVNDLDVSNIELGASIAVNGVCLTAIDYTKNSFMADASKETLALTTLGQLPLNAVMNFERSLTLQDPLGGHLVSGHVDGLAEVVEITQAANAWHIRLRAPVALSRYIAKKGSVCLDGISLTVNEVAGHEFEVMIIPHTHQVTNIHTWKKSTKVNLEVDLIARYVERLFTSETQAGTETSAQDGLTYEKILGSGFSRPE